MNHGKDGSWSDSESGFLHPPIKSKLKGLLGKGPFIYYVRMFWGYSRLLYVLERNKYLLFYLTTPKYYVGFLKTPAPLEILKTWSDSESGFLHPPIKSKLKGLFKVKRLFMATCFRSWPEGNFNYFSFFLNSSSPKIL